LKSESVATLIGPADPMTSLGYYALLMAPRWGRGGLIDPTVSTVICRSDSDSWNVPLFPSRERTF